MRVSKASFAAGAAAALVIGSGTAFAATGGNFILGKSNSASATTTLTDGYGTPLALNAKSGYPALKVNSKSKVANLNADYLDNKDISAFALSTGKTGTIWSTTGGFWTDLDYPADGVIDGAFDYVECPAGTILVGGGGDDETGGALVVSSAVGTGVWGVVSSTTPPDGVQEGDPAPIWASAQCYNPKGAVPGADFRAGNRVSIDALRARVAR